MMETSISLTNDIISASRRLEETMKRERSRLLAFIRRRVSTDEDAEDILQDVFYRLLSSYSVTAPIEQLTSWLFHVARNRVIDWYRTQKGTVALAQESDVSGSVDQEYMLFDPADNPETLLAHSLFRAELEDALEELPEPQREVFIMHEIQGMRFKEIATLTGESVNTLLSRKRYAILFLRTRLRDHFQDIISE
jgi:RNA polymerase sigma factor (sigma-70 family)